MLCINKIILFTFSTFTSAQFLVTVFVVVKEVGDYLNGWLQIKIIIIITNSPSSWGNVVRIGADGLLHESA